MLRGWVEFLPLILVRKIADSECERVYLHGKNFAIPRPGVMIEVNERPVPPNSRHIYDLGYA